MLKQTYCHADQDTVHLENLNYTFRKKNLGRGRMSLKGGRWHERTDCDFEDNAFGELREGKDFSDVTLASEDVQQVEAHKEVLTSSSPFF